MSDEARLDHEGILGQRWGGLHTCGQRVEMLWVTPTLSAMQGLPGCLHLDITGATYTPHGHLRCERCGCLLIERPDGQVPIEPEEG